MRFMNAPAYMSILHDSLTEMEKIGVCGRFLFLSVFPLLFSPSVCILFFVFTVFFGGVLFLLFAILFVCENIP